MKIMGIKTRNGCEFFVDDKPVQHIIKHSPDGMNMGYGGSGPSDTALSILCMVMPRHEAEKYYQQFKWAFVAEWKDNKIETEINLDDWLNEIRSGV
jgi:hypothetical protein